MQLEINGKEYNFKFGIRFIKEMDKKYSVLKEGIPFSVSLDMIASKLIVADTPTLCDVLAVASQTESPRPKLSEIEEYIEETVDVEALFDMVVDALETSNATKLGFTRAKQELTEKMQVNLTE